MAVVKFSNELRETIAKQAGVIYKKRIDALSASFPSDWGVKIYDRIFGEYEAVFKSMPKELFRWDTSLHISTNVVISSGERCAFSRQFEFRNGTLREYVNVPPARKHLASCRYTSDTTNLDLRIESPEWDDLRKDIITYLDGINAIEAERDNFVDSVNKIVNAYTTLAPALKAWPPLWDLLPEQIKDRHKTVVVREKKERTLDDIDLSSMTAAVIANKISE